MPYTNYNGRLNANKMFSGLYNMIISQEVFTDNFGKHQTLVDKARVDGGLYGDTKLYYSADVLKSKAWDPTAASSLLTRMPAPAPACQAIKLDVFRQIGITIDNYLTKQAWAEEGSFSSFNAVLIGMLRETKKVYDGTTYNVFCGTTVSGATKSYDTVALSGTNDGQAIAEKLANILVDMSDYSRDYNEIGFLRSYDPANLGIIWNSNFVNKIKKVDLPSIFHKDGLVPMLDTGDTLPARYFGTSGQLVAALTTAGVLDSSGKVVANKGARFVTETEISGTNYFAGDLIPAGTVVKDASAGTNEILSSNLYVENAKIICKIYSKLPPYMSGFEVGTNFYDYQSLRENTWLTFAHNTLDLIDDSVFFTLKQA